VLDDALGEVEGEVHPVVADLAKREDVERIFAEVDARLGGLDILISNAALGADPIDQMANDDWRSVVALRIEPRLQELP
jgi:3-hydroxy acid dehydrogenase/malonic semialdehyde reductase